MFISGEPGGCGICPAAVTGLQGDRGSQGYRGRPGVSIHEYIDFDFLILVYS